MPINMKRFKRQKGVAGLRWDAKNKEALFRVVTIRGGRRKSPISVQSFESLEDAKEAFFAYRFKIKSGEDSVPAEPANPQPATPSATSTLGEYVEIHWKSLHARCAESTERTNKNIHKNLVEPFFGTMKIDAISEANCEDFVAANKDKSPYTINLGLRFLRKALHHARRRNLRSDVPENFHFVKEEMLKLELNEEEEARFLAAFNDYEGFKALLRDRQKKGKVLRSARFGFKERVFGGSRRPDSDASAAHFQRFRRSRLIFTAAIDLGYRVTDLRLLRRRDIDFKKGIASIKTEKTGKPAIVALSDRCREAIETAMSNEISNTEYVFTTNEGKPYSESTLRDYFADAKKIAGITRRFRVNDMRHTFASNLASEGLSAFEIRDALGHTTVRMSERYAKPNEHSLDRMRDALNARQKRNGATQCDPNAQSSGQ